MVYEPTETSPEVTTIAGFLAGYSGPTREAYTLDLRQSVRWCHEHRIRLFEVARTHIEIYARRLEDDSKAPATIGRRLSTLAVFPVRNRRGVLDHSPAVRVQRPKLDNESYTAGLDRNELGGFLVQAGLSGADIGDRGLERRHRTLVVHRGVRCSSVRPDVPVVVQRVSRV